MGLLPHRRLGLRRRSPARSSGRNCSSTWICVSSSSACLTTHQRDGFDRTVDQAFCPPLTPGTIQSPPAFGRMSSSQIFMAPPDDSFWEECQYLRVSLCYNSSEAMRCCSPTLLAAAPGSRYQQIFNVAVALEKVADGLEQLVNALQRPPVVFQIQIIVEKMIVKHKRYSLPGSPDMVYPPLQVMSLTSPLARILASVRSRLLSHFSEYPETGSSR